MTAWKHVPPVFVRASLIQTAFLLCVSWLPSVVLAEPVNSQATQPAGAARLVQQTEEVTIEPAGSSSSEDLIPRQSFPSGSDGVPGNPGEHKTFGESDNHKDGVLRMEETVVESTFDDPFAIEGEQVEDPWEPLNSRIFTLNYNIDRYALKPVVRVYSGVVPPDVQDSLANVFDNLGFASRFLNSMFQGKIDRAGIEMQRFLLNSILGVGGLFDVARYMFGIEAPPAEDAGQTLATYEVASGPYMVLPLLPPMTVRDAVGYAGDIFMNPVNYFIPFVPNIGLNVTGRLNDRAINIKTFEGLEESTVDLYGATRSGYLDRRAKDIQE